MYSTGVGLVLKGFEYLEQYPSKFEHLEEEKEEEGPVVQTEPTLIDRINDWFTKDEVN